MNRIFLYLLMICVIVTATSCQLPGSVGRLPESSNPGVTAVPVEKVLSAFRTIEGTSYLMAEISANPDARQTGSNPLSWIESGYSAYSYQTYNYVFFDLESESYHRLLPNNRSAILQTIGFPTPTYDPAAPEQPSPPIEWWLFTVVTADTDQNGRLDYDDKLTLGISDVGGNVYTEVVTNVDNVLGQIYKDNSSLFVLYHSDSKNYLAKIALPSREVVMTTEMDLGGDVK